MNDLIYKQEAIEVANAVLVMTGDKNVAKVWQQIKDLPSARPEITLELAIDYLYKIGWMQEHDRILTESARPEIIRCKDCEYFLPPHGCGHIDGMVTADENGFCSYAKQKGENDGEIRN